MKSVDLFQAFSEIEPKYMDQTDIFHRKAPTWRVIMKKTTKLALSAAAVVLVLGFILTAWWLQSRYGVAPAQEGEEEPLRVCIDLGHNQVAGQSGPQFMETVRKQLSSVSGSQAFEIEIIPHGTQGDREAVLQRIRTEIMAGGGPDVFIVDCSEAFHANFGGEDEALFPFPESAMQNAFFLPLDDSISTVGSSEWEKIPRVLMDAGRSQEGQLILPLAYTLPLTLFPATEQPTVNSRRTWAEQLKDEKDCCRLAGIHVGGWYSGCFSSTFSCLADYQSGRLSFSESDLLDHLQRAVDLREEKKEVLAQDEHQLAEVYLSPNFTVGSGFPSDQFGWCPMYSSDGGVVATITSFAAINRNTRHAQQAFEVLDQLLSKDLINYNLQTMGELLYTTRMPANMEALNYYECLPEIVDTVQWARFHSPLDAALEELFHATWQEANASGNGSVFMWTKEDYPRLVRDTYQKLQRLLDES